jgi:GNAT superfamily N-acetyltransferase
MTAVRRLQAACEDFGRQDLKVTPRETDPGPVPTQFLAQSGGVTVGYCGVDLGQDPEVCGMVHPDHRLHGIGAGLLDAALQACAAIGRDSALVICEDVAPEARAWLERRGAQLDSSELRMVLDLGADPVAARPAPVVDLRAATSADRPHLRRLLGDGFPHMDGALLDEMIDRVQAGGDESFMAWEGERPAGTVRLFHTPARSMVYGLVIDPGLRGRGYGRAVMIEALALLRARGIAEVSLEVLPDNEAAVRLYSGLGFVTRTTYRYMRLATA